MVGSLGSTLANPTNPMNGVTTSNGATLSDTRIEAGELNVEMAFESDVGTDETSVGEHVPDWQPWGTPTTRWVGVRQLSAREIERAAMLYAEATHLVTMRYVAGVTPVKMRGKVGSRVFNFGAVNNVNEANIKLEILACERIA